MMLTEAEHDESRAGTVLRQSAGPVHRDTAGAPSAIRAERLVREFGGVRAVDEVDLDIPRGEIYGFLGPNGAGKSTTVRVLCTLLSPTAGRAVVAGHDLAASPDKIRRRIGVALQEAALDPKQTGTELLKLQGRLYGMSRAETNVRLAELAGLIDLGEALERPIGTYSGGMKRRLDLAAALIHDPELLFLDEPTTGLDPVSRVRMWEEVRRLNRERGITIFLTTQYLEEADELADRVGIINGGQLVAEGTPGELKRSVGNDVIVARVDGRAEASRLAVQNLSGVRNVDVRGEELVVTADDGASTIGAVAVALDGISPVRQLTLRTPTLDDVFLELTGNRIRNGADGSVPAAGDPVTEDPVEVGS